MTGAAFGPAGGPGAASVALGGRREEEVSPEEEALATLARHPGCGQST